MLNRTTINYVRDFAKNISLSVHFQLKKKILNNETIAALNYPNTTNSFQFPLPLYATQIINPFCNSRISESGKTFNQCNGEILVKGIVSLWYLLNLFLCIISFKCTNNFILRYSFLNVE